MIDNEGSGYRAGWCKVILRHLEGRLRDRNLAPESALPQRPAELMRSTPSISWIPIASLSDLLVAAHEALGDSDYMDSWREIIMATMTEFRLIAPTVTFLLRTFGATPFAVVRGLPATWKLMTRGVGEFSHDRISESCCLVILSKFPPALFNDTQVRSYEGGLRAFIHLVGCEGTVTAQNIAYGSGRVEFKLAWKPKSGR
jgi:hypothetical protein